MAHHHQVLQGTSIELGPSAAPRRTLGLKVKYSLKKTEQERAFMPGRATEFEDQHMGVYTVSADPQSLSELIEKLADGLPQTNTVRRLLVT